MNNTIVIALASLGALLWLVAVLRERMKSSATGTVFNFMKRFFPNTATEVASGRDASVAEPAAMTIESLERELGIEPDHYLCDRIARINEALVARRDKAAPKKKGGAS